MGEMNELWQRPLLRKLQATGSALNGTTGGSSLMN